MFNCHLKFTSAGSTTNSRRTGKNIQLLRMFTRNPKNLYCQYFKAPRELFWYVKYPAVTLLGMSIFDGFGSNTDWSPLVFLHLLALPLLTATLVKWLWFLVSNVLLVHNPVNHYTFISNFKHYNLLFQQNQNKYNKISNKKLYT